MVEGLVVSEDEQVINYLGENYYTLERALEIIAAKANIAIEIKEE